MSDRSNNDDVLPPISVTPKRASEITGIPERSIREAMGKTLPVAGLNERVKVIMYDTLKQWVKGLERSATVPSQSTNPFPGRRACPADRTDLIGRMSFRRRSR